MESNEKNTTIISQKKSTPDKLSLGETDTPDIIINIGEDTPYDTEGGEPPYNPFWESVGHWNRYWIDFSSKANWPPMTFDDNIEHANYLKPMIKFYEIDSKYKKSILEYTNEHGCYTVNHYLLPANLERFSDIKPLALTKEFYAHSHDLVNNNFLEIEVFHFRDLRGKKKVQIFKSPFCSPEQLQRIKSYYDIISEPEPEPKKKKSPAEIVDHNVDVQRLTIEKEKENRLTIEKEKENNLTKWGMSYVAKEVSPQPKLKPCGKFHNRITVCDKCISIETSKE